MLKLSLIHDNWNRSVQEHERINLLVDIQNWLVKQMAAVLAYLQDNGLTEYGQLEKRAAKAFGLFHLSD